MTSVYTDNMCTCEKRMFFVTGMPHYFYILYQMYVCCMYVCWIHACAVYIDTEWSVACPQVLLYRTMFHNATI